MFDRDKWQEIFGTIRKNKLRTALTALGVFWGVFMLIFLLGMGQGLENGVYNNFSGKMKNIMFVRAWRTSIPHDGFPAGRRINLTLNDVDAINTVPSVGKTAPRKHIGTNLITHGELSGSYDVRGELTEMINIASLKLTEGRYVNEQDVEESRKVVVLGNTVKDVLFGDEEAIGKHVKIRGIDFKVVGIYSPMQVREWTRDDSESVVIPLTTMRKAFGTSERIDWVICAAKPGVRVSDMETKVRSLLRERHNVSPEDPDAIRGFNLEEEFQKFQNLFTGIKGFLWFVGIGTLIAGIVGVSNIMLIIVKERTKEIGIRKALGATPGSIISMILTESVFITSLSGYLGLAFGTLTIGMINFIMVSNNLEAENFANPEVNIYAGVGAIVMLVIAGTIAGLIPALQAAKINPVVALKDE